MSGILYHYVDFQISRNEMVSCDDCQEWFHISIHVQYDGVLFDREWYSVNWSRNTDLHNLTGCM